MTYRLEPFPATQRQSTSNRGTISIPGREGLTCGGGFLPLPEEPNIVDESLPKVEGPGANSWCCRDLLQRKRRGDPQAGKVGR